MDQDSYSVDQFCDRHGISRSYFYQMKREGKGPKLMKLGVRTLISREAAEAWRRQVEAGTSSAA